jgi:23S rRNA pseudouridine2605 synthase
MFAAGRLDLNSEGLLLVTNDGELANRLTHPRYEHEKEYLALVVGTPVPKTLDRMERGILYEGEWLRADRVTRAGRQQKYGEAGRDETWLRVLLHEGKKRQIRHICAAVGHPVNRLVRVRIGSLTLGNLKPAEWRRLAPAEVTQLREATRPRTRARPTRRPVRSSRRVQTAPRVQSSGKRT